MKETIGFIGQGWIGKHYADDFEARGYTTVRYALEAPYNQNESQLQQCQLVFVAVPTPTTKDGFNCTAVKDALAKLAPTTIAIIKSTLLPGTTESLQEEFTEITILHSPEFLREASAAHDAAHPKRNIIGIPVDSKQHNAAAQRVLNVLPVAPYSAVLPAKAAELVKYAGNCFLYTKVVFMNMLYDIAESEGLDWSSMREALVADPRIGESHTDPVHVSGHNTDKSQTVRGAGGHCFIKDFEAFIGLYDKTAADDSGVKALQSLRDYNNQLLIASKKDLDLLNDVYGEEMIKSD